MSRERKLKQLKLRYEKIISDALETFTIDEVRLLIQEIEARLENMENSSKE